MEIVSIKTDLKGEAGRIELSDGSLFSFKNCYLPKELIDNYTENPIEAAGKEIASYEEAAFRFASACLRAEKSALRLIARAEQCTFGLSRKLEKRGHEAACARAAITRLLELNLLNDNRFACLWLESRLRLAKSPRRLLVSLCGKGIDHDDAQAALKTVLDEETEFLILTRFVKKSARKSGGKGESARALKYLLKSEGFSFRAIERFLGGDF